MSSPAPGRADVHGPAPQELVEAALAASAADGCIVVDAEHSETNLRFAANSLTTNGQMRSRSLTVIATFDRPGGTTAGSVTRSVTSVEEIPELVRAADAAARDADPAEDAGPLTEPYPHDDDWDAPPARTGVDVFAAFAPELGAAFARWSAADRLLYGFAEHQMTSTYLGLSTGLRRRFDQPTGRLELNGKTGDLSGSTWSGVHTRDFTDVDVRAATDALEQRLDWGARTVDLPAGRYETILPPTSVADLLIGAYWRASARDAEEGRSVYSATGSEGGTRIGETVSPFPIELRSDPAEPGLQCAPFAIVSRSSAGHQSVFDNGAPLGATSWIEDGRFAELIRTGAWARRTGRAVRPAIDNLVLTSPGATATLDDMIASTGRGLLVTSMWYLREVDPQTALTTGLTRDGVFLVEDGEVQGRVTNFRFNESPIDLLGRVTEIGATVPAISREWSDYFLRTAMPPMRIPDFNMSTVSQAS